MGPESPAVETHCCTVYARNEVCARWSRVTIGHDVPHQSLSVVTLEELLLIAAD